MCIRSYFFVAVLVWTGLQPAPLAQSPQPSAPGPRIVVPAVKAVPVVVDGKFLPGEWEGAFRQPLGEDFEVYLLADGEHLCVGFKYLKDVEADYLSEVYVATSDKQFLNLHSSGSLGEGVNGLPLPGGRTTFTIVAPLGASRAAWWESNAMPRSVAGVQGKEFKINRARLPAGTVLSASGALLTSNSGSRAQADRPVTGQQAVVRQDAATPGEPPPPRDFSGLTGPYLGQSPPGTTPQVFAPNAVSTTARELNSVFTPDGREFYFTIQGEGGRWTIMRSALEHAGWTAPTPASFSGKWSDVDLFITADGRQLYFCSNRPVQGDAPKDFDIWVSDRAGAGWSDPRNLGAPINSPAAEFYPTLTRDGTMYFQSQRPGGHGAADIWRARLREGRYVEAECLPGPVNTSGFEGDAFIAPDESYLIVSTRVATIASSAVPPTAKPDGVAAQSPPPPPPPPGLFLSVPRADGTWSALVSLGDAVNSARAGVNCQMLSPDGRYLFFTRGGDIHWVDAAVVEQAKRQALEAR